VLADVDELRLATAGATGVDAWVLVGAPALAAEAVGAAGGKAGAAGAAGSSGVATLYRGPDVVGAACTTR